MDREIQKGGFMALKRVTMQEIADACGLSRNTVSKVFNERGSVPAATRNLVLAKANELGYYQRSLTDEPASENVGTIAVLTQHKLLSHNFGAFFITAFTNSISRNGYTMKMYELSKEEIATKKFPARFDPEQTTGILGIELFDREYIDMICSLNVPTVFVDGYPGIGETLINCDIISMENIVSETTLVERMIAAGGKSFGFVGDIEHCNSFYERWIGFCRALEKAGLPVDKDLCILEKDGLQYEDTKWLLEQLSAMPKMPDGFACANDYLAIHLMSALKEKGSSIPKDIMIAGFDSSLEAAVIEPSLSTAEIPATDIGKLAASILQKRIQEPSFPFNWTYVKTRPIWGNSTR